MKLKKKKNIEVIVIYVLVTISLVTFLGFLVYYADEIRASLPDNNKKDKKISINIDGKEGVEVETEDEVLKYIEELDKNNPYKGKFFDSKVNLKKIIFVYPDKDKLFKDIDNNVITSNKKNVREKTKKEKFFAEHIKDANKTARKALKEYLFRENIYDAKMFISVANKVYKTTLVKIVLAYFENKSVTFLKSIIEDDKKQDLYYEDRDVYDFFQMYFLYKEKNYKEMLAYGRNLRKNYFVQVLLLKFYYEKRIKKRFLKVAIKLANMRKENILIAKYYLGMYFSHTKKYDASDNWLLKCTNPFYYPAVKQYMFNFFKQTGMKYYYQVYFDKPLPLAALKYKELQNSPYMKLVLKDNREKIENIISLLVRSLTKNNYEAWPYLYFLYYAKKEYSPDDDAYIRFLDLYDSYKKKLDTKMRIKIFADICYLRYKLNKSDLFLKKSIKYYKLASQKGLAEADLMLSIIYEKNKTNVLLSVKHLQKAKKADYPKAIFRDAIIYNDGRFVDKNDKFAVTKLKVAVRNRKNYYAAYYLADMYFYGNIVKKDFHRGFDYYLKAAALGNIKAHIKLGNYFEFGYSAGVHKNIPKAIHHYLIAAKYGYTEAMWNLANIYLINEKYKNKKRAYDWLKKAAFYGNQKAKNFLRNKRK